MVDTDSLTIGDKVILTKDGRDVTLTVWKITAPGSAGTRYSAGPHIYAHIRPGGFGITFDRGSHEYRNIRPA